MYIKMNGYANAQFLLIESEAASANIVILILHTDNHTFLKLFYIFHFFWYSTVTSLLDNNLLFLPTNG